MYVREIFQKFSAVFHFIALRCRTPCTLWSSDLWLRNGTECQKMILFRTTARKIICQSLNTIRRTAEAYVVDMSLSTLPTISASAFIQTPKPAQKPRRGAQGATQYLHINYVRLLATGDYKHQLHPSFIIGWRHINAPLHWYSRNFFDSYRDAGKMISLIKSCYGNTQMSSSVFSAKYQHTLSRYHNITVSSQHYHSESLTYTARTPAIQPWKYCYGRFDYLLF